LHAAVIDTGVFVAMERERRPLSTVALAAPMQLHALASISVAELLFGVERADTEERRRRRSDVVAAILAAIPVVPLDVEVARTVARIWAELESTGNRIGSYDLIVAATALVNGYDVLTLNVREFERVPGLTVIRPEWP
jgi:tRNA(fMet)-specific endonuclease VapC